MSEKVLNALFGGQPDSLTYAGYGECPSCGDDCAEFWVDRDGRRYVRCPYFMCENWGTPRRVETLEEDE